MNIRTLHLINGLGTGGAERSLAELLPDLPAHRIEPRVVVFHQRAEGVEDEVRASGIRIHHVRAAGWAGRIRAVRRIVRDQRPDLVHTTIFEADVVGRLATVGLGVPVLTSLVNTSYDTARLEDPNVTTLRLRGAQVIDGVTARFLGDHFHAITQAVKEAAVRDLRLRARDVTVVPRGRRRARLGERTPQRRAEVRARLGLATDATVLLHVGRQEYQKGHDILLDAVGPLLAERDDVHLLLAGRSGNTTPAIEERLRTMPGNQVHVLGHSDDVPDLMVAADVFVFPSRFEGLGGAALEAMALETPIVAADLPALREFLVGVAILVPAADSAALRDGIRAALSDPVTAMERASSARRRFDDRFEHRCVVSNMAAVLATAASTDK